MNWIGWDDAPPHHRADDRDDPIVHEGWLMIGSLVRERRLALGLTQRQLQEATGITQPAISRLERGRLRGLRWARFGRLVAVMGGLGPGTWPGREIESADSVDPAMLGP